MAGDCGNRPAVMVSGSGQSPAHNRLGSLPPGQQRVAQQKTYRRQIGESACQLGEFLDAVCPHPHAQKDEGRVQLIGFGPLVVRKRGGKQDAACSEVLQARLAKCKQNLCRPIWTFRVRQCLEQPDGVLIPSGSRQCVSDAERLLKIDVVGFSLNADVQPMFVCSSCSHADFPYSGRSMVTACRRVADARSFHSQPHTADFTP